MDKFTQLRLARAEAYELAEHITKAHYVNRDVSVEAAVDDAESSLERIAMLMGFDLVRPVRKQVA